MQQFEQVIEALEILQEDTTVPKNVKTKLTDMITDLSSTDDGSMVINKLLSDLEDISSDINLQPFVRTQLFNISSMLECL